jgi:hypothetical protein
MVAVIREVQIPLLAVVLMCGCLAKAWYTVRIRDVHPGDAHLGEVHPGEVHPGTGATATFPLGAGRPAAYVLCVVEFVLGAGLLVSAGSAGAGLPALTIRLAVALLFATAAGALYVLRARRPDAGCGCFGDLSRTPVGWRVIARAVLLCLAALSVVRAPPLRMPTSAGQAWLILAVTAASLALIGALSPEIGVVMRRLSHAEPCEVRAVPVARTLAALHATPVWRRYQRFIVAEAPTDVWREGCWRFIVYPAVLASRRMEVVFAVHLAGRGVPVRIGMLDTGTDFEVPRQPTGDQQLLFSKLV